MVAHVELEGADVVLECVFFAVLLLCPDKPVLGTPRALPKRAKGLKHSQGLEIEPGAQGLETKPRA